MSERTENFIEALHSLEQNGDAKAIAALFAESADVSNPLVKHDGEGEQGALAFWTAYRAAFESIRSDFRNIAESGDVAMLEWVSEGETRDGPVRYGGVSVLEHGEGGIAAFRTYFNPSKVSAPTSR